MDQANSKRYFLNFGPELLKLLGPNLYTNIYYVLSEIIANAYDADAENVYILYSRTNNTIIIEDDGNGMTYEQVNSKYLPVGVQSRFDSTSTYSEKFGRRRMGRKGIGKLAALSVSSRVLVKTMRDGEKSGCVLTLTTHTKNEKGQYEIPGLSDDQINFIKITGNHGSSITMENSRYALYKAIDPVKRNISSIFPLSDNSFKIHVENLDTQETSVIEDNAEILIPLADTLITFFDEDQPNKEHFVRLHKYFQKDRYYSEIERVLPQERRPPKAELDKREPALRRILSNLLTNDFVHKDYDLVIYGWIATYASTKGRRQDSEFSPNHISIIANGKVGQYDVLREISTDRVGESYVFGQFHVDLLEKTELPDIAASNRQGYIEDDPRYKATLEEIRKALNLSINLKTEATKEKNYLSNLRKQEELKKSKTEYDAAMEIITEDPLFKSVIENSTPIREILQEAWGIKNILTNSYKKILISHCSESKEIVDELEKVLHHCGITPEQIIYTSSNHFESTIGAFENIYTFLQEFFVNTVKKNDLCVIYILNNNFNTKWDPVLEAGAGWVIKTTSFPFYTDEFTSVKAPFPRESHTPKLSFGMTTRERTLFAAAIREICKKVGIVDISIPTLLTYITNSTKF